MESNQSLILADLVELYDAEVAYMANPSVQSQRNLTHVFVHNLAYAIEDGVLLVRFEREEGVITQIKYHGHYGITTTERTPPPPEQPAGRRRR